MKEHDFEFSVILEPTDCEIQLGCLGALNASLVIRGKSAHSARPWMGENPIYKLNEVIDFVSKNEIKPVLLMVWNLKRFFPLHSFILEWLIM